MKTFKKTVAIFLFLLLITFSESSFSQPVLTHLPETTGSPYGDINGMLSSNDTIFLVGLFNKVGNLNRDAIATINGITGDILNFQASTSGYGIATIAETNGILYVGGGFKTIGGQNRVAIAAIDKITGTIKSWNPILTVTKPGFSPSITKIVAASNYIFIQGDYNSINGVTTSSPSVLDANTGQLINSFSINRHVNSALVVNNILYLGGDFTSIMGQTRNYLASVNLNNNTLTNWNPNPNGVVNKILYANGKIYVGGNYSIIGQSFREGLAYVDTITGIQGNWHPLTVNGVGVTDMAITNDNMIYVVNSILKNFDLTSGIKYDEWMVGASIVSTGVIVIVGGSFNKIGWVNRNNLCAVIKGLSLGVNEVNNFIQKISVFPNPANNKISFSVNETNNKILNIIITNILGETVFNNMLNYQKEIEIPVTDLNSGIYFIKIQSGNNTYAGKFVKE